MTPESSWGFLWIKLSLYFIVSDNLNWTSVDFKYIKCRLWIDCVFLCKIGKLFYCQGILSTRMEHLALLYSSLVNDILDNVSMWYVCTYVTIQLYNYICLLCRWLTLFRSRKTFFVLRNVNWVLRILLRIQYLLSLIKINSSSVIYQNNQYFPKYFFFCFVTIEFTVGLLFHSFWRTTIWQLF